MNKHGFTFIEVLVAMLIFVMAVIASVNVTDGSVRATREAKEISQATWLLQNVMVELETRLETEGFEKACEAKKEAKFEPPYEKYTWTTFCNEIDFNLSQSASQIMANQEKGKDTDSTQEDMVQKYVLDIASEYIGKSLREIHAEVSWTQGKQKRKIDATSHVARYDTQLALPAIPANNSGGGTN